MDKYIGRLLDNRYEILEVIGTGGMAVVYKARCHRLNRLVAIKILKDEYLEDEEFRRRFHSESQAVAMLSHPNIVSVYDVSSSVTADYIVMELIDGITLKQYMEKKGVLNWKETLHFAIQVGKALEHAHSKGIVHRDIKPHNVMVLKNGSVKVTDFGIARMMSKGNTLTKEALGSVHYISPEQAKGGRVDNRSDIYSLGVVMYEMMSGRPPYDGESPVAVAIQHINGGAAMPSTLNPNIPGGLEQIIMKAMAHETADRYNSATQMLTDMDEFRKNPAILFDYNAQSAGDVIDLPKPPLVLEPDPAPVTTAERVERGKTDISQLPQRRKTANAARSGSSNQPRRREERHSQRSSNTATIAIIACCAVMVIAIVVFLVVLFSDGTGANNNKQDLVEVPNLVGQQYVNLPNYPNFKIEKKEAYDDSRPAGEIIDQNPVAGSKIKQGNTIYVTVSLGVQPEDILMPMLKNITRAEAEQRLNALPLKLRIGIEEEYSDDVAVGCVVSTDPKEGTTLSSDHLITLYVSKGKKPGTMPDVVGETKEEAERRLGLQNLDLEFVEEPVYDSAENEGTVVRTEPAANAEIIQGQKITLYVSRIKTVETVEIKNIIGLSVEASLSVLKNDGITNYQIEPVVSDKEKDTVIEMRAGDKTLHPGDKIDANTKIILVVSLGKNASSLKTKDVVIDLQGCTDTSDCEVMITCDGNSVYNNIVEKGVKTVTLPNQTGSGEVTYKLIVGGDDWGKPQVEQF